MHHPGLEPGHRRAASCCPFSLGEGLVRFGVGNGTARFVRKLGKADIALGSAPCKIVWMQYEKVYTVWDLYDGIRTGTADLGRAPHYFAAHFDERAGDYSGNFKLYPVEPEFMQNAMRNWHIYRAWERKFHTGQADLKTHPGHGGIDLEYDSLKLWLDHEITLLQQLPVLYRAQFRALPDQDELPDGMFPEFEVAWSLLPAGSCAATNVQS